MIDRLRAFGRRVLPVCVQRCIVRATRWPPVGLVCWGSLRRLTPISRIWGCDRGQPVDRYWIGQFLSIHTMDIQGHVLEVNDDDYTVRYGGGRVTRSDVLHKSEGNPQATIVADLAHAPELPADTFDCIICTQTLQLVYDVRAAVETLHRILKPGGVLLVTVPGIAQICRDDTGTWEDCWRFTAFSAGSLFGEVFSQTNVTVQAYGNVRSAIAFLHGLASQELSRRALDHVDPDYQVLIAVRAVKPQAAA
ncbi:MAG: methyltransferase domain-containing protein [Anaerolineae bacterium]|nr:methyltransferase domain-containing protein [Anaerolineae bacterium]